MSISCFIKCVYHEKDKYYIRTNKVMERMYEKELQFLPKDYVIQKYVHDKKIKLKTQVVHHYVDKENIYSAPTKCNYVL